MDFPHGKRNKIILAARELERLIDVKVEEEAKQKELAEEIK